MELFNIGIGELLVILVLMYVVLGPQGMLRAARWLGQVTRQAYRFFNETWRSITDVPMDLRDLPRALLDETGLAEPFEELKQDTRAIQADLHETAGSLNQTIRPPQAAKPPADARSNGPGAIEQPSAEGGEEAEDTPPVERVPLNIRPVSGTVAAAQSPAQGRYPAADNPPSCAPEPSGAAESDAEPPRYKRGRPRKGEVRPPPPPKRKRGRPPKNRPEATAAGEPAPQPPPVMERPAELPPQSRLPRRAPSQPGGPLAPLDLDPPQGARAYDSQPAPTGEDDAAPEDHPTSHPNQETTDSNAA